MKATQENNLQNITEINWKRDKEWSSRENRTREELKNEIMKRKIIFVKAMDFVLFYILPNEFCIYVLSILSIQIRAVNAW